MAKKKNPSYYSNLNILVYGQGNLGKTTTLRRLYKNLTGNVLPKNCSRKYFPYRGKQIVLCTAGDTRKIVVNNISELKKHATASIYMNGKNNHTDIFISAVNQKFDSYEAMQNLQEEIIDGTVDSKYILWIEKLNPKKEEHPYVKGSTKTSDRDADRLKNIIDFYIDNNLI